MLTPNRRFALALEALAELKTEISTSPQTQPIPVAPTLREVLTEVGPLPREALFLGKADDGLPVLLNLHDPVPGPVLMSGDAGSGKTAFLQTIAAAAVQAHTPKDLQFGVITGHPDEWKTFAESPHCIGIFPVHHNSAQDFLLSLASWAHANKSPRQSVLLLADDMTKLVSLDFTAQQNLHWLLARGPSRRVWPILTLKAEQYGEIIPWLSSFRTRIFGRICDRSAADALAGDPKASLDQLQAGVQFSLREGGHWLRFWTPSIS